MTRLTTFSFAFLFLSLSPALCSAQSSIGRMGTTEFLCDVNDDGRLEILRSIEFLNDRPDVFDVRNRKKALRDRRKILKKQRASLKQLSRATQNLIDIDNPDLDGLSLQDVFSRIERKGISAEFFKKVVNNAQESGVLSLDAPNADELLLLTPKQVRAVLEANGLTKAELDFAAKNVLQGLKDCNGCASNSEQVFGIRSLRRKKKRKKKCDCYSKRVSASMEFHIGNDPDAQNNCQYFGLAKWSADETKNAQSVEVFYSWNGGGGAPIRSKTGTPPYDDVYPFYDKEIVAGAGSHQLLIAYGAGSHSNTEVVADCSDSSARQQELFTDPYVVANICPLGKKKK